MKKNILIISAIVVVFFLKAQIVTTEPNLPTENDLVIITYDATQGTAGLKDYIGEVYAHIGVITNKSTSSSDWKYDPTIWGDNSAKYKMTRISGQANKYTLRIEPNVRQYFGMATTDTAKKIAMVFRSADKTKEGKATGGADILTDLFKSELSLKLLSPTDKNCFVKIDSTIIISAIASSHSALKIYIDGSEVKSVTDATVSYSYKVTEGSHVVKVIAVGGSQTKEEIVSVIAAPTTVIAEMPAGLEDGINVINDSTVTFVLYAPFKSKIFVYGDFSNWLIKPENMMKKTPDGNRFWLTIKGFEPYQEYLMQYVVLDAQPIIIGDPYSEKVLTPNDKWYFPQNPTVYPGLKAYPEGLTQREVTCFYTKKTQFNWTVTNFSAPVKENLVVYEMLIRDFCTDKAIGTYKQAMSKIPYLKNLGINAVELMPVMEFEGDNSWGYNTSFHGALDKAYGSDVDFKKFVDSCHKSGIAVILDIAVNHGYGQCPLARLYNKTNGSPSDQIASNNPWFNETPTHPYNVGCDFNHTSVATKNYVKRIVKYWINEYKIDGYRFDLSKGFYQSPSTTDVGTWGNYNQTRVDIIKDYNSYIKSIKSNAYVILEHLGDNDEEKAFVSEGMMPWGNMQNSYKELGLGTNQDISWVSSKNRGFNSQLLMAYAESHDEERAMYEMLNYGKVYGTYNVKTLATALKRMEMLHALLLPIPGPKMIWQFAEIGFDYSVKQEYVNGVLTTQTSKITGMKPVKWDYYSIADRKTMYKNMSKLIYYKTHNAIFGNPGEYWVDLGSSKIEKEIGLKDAGSNTYVNIIANPDLINQNMTLDFAIIGKYYDLMTGDSIDVSSTQKQITIGPGEYKMYSNKKLNGWNYSPSDVQVTKIEEMIEKIYYSRAYFNNGEICVELDSKKAQDVTIDLYSVMGIKICSFKETVDEGGYKLKFNLPFEASTGVYFVRVNANRSPKTHKILIK